MTGAGSDSRRPPDAARRAEGATLVAEMAQARPPNGPAHDPSRILVPVVAAHGTEGAAHHARSAEELASHSRAAATWWWWKVRVTACT